MAAEFKHHRYFRLRNDDSSLQTFTSVDDAKTRCALNDTLYNTGNPTRTYALADSDQGLKMTMEFDSLADQDSFITAASNAWTDGTVMFASGVEVYKHEWLHPDGTVSDTTNF
jgi:hypothetical protein